MKSHAFGVLQVMLKRWKPFSSHHQWKEEERNEGEESHTGHVPVNCQMSNSSLETTMPYIIISLPTISYHQTPLTPRALSHAPLKD